MLGAPMSMEEARRVIAARDARVRKIVEATEGPLIHQCVVDLSFALVSMIESSPDGQTRADAYRTALILLTSNALPARLSDGVQRH